MDRLNMKSGDVADTNVAKIAALFPQCVTETAEKVIKQDGTVKYVSRYAIDFDKLRAELSKDVLDAGEERYQFTWPDKRAASRLANEPTDKTLRPDIESSVDFWNTKNLYIEGDNLDVLKVLRENYLGKVNMIYIDPPYNTGNDFVYNDDFAQSREDFEANSGLFDEDGNQTVDPMVRNTESNGRYHTDWLNMIYPRLKVARDLLAEDGVIFISIDDNEQDNLRKVTDEIFGESNFIAQIVNVNNIAGRSDSRHIATAHEYVLMYQKSPSFVSKGLPLTDEQKKEYRFSDEKGNYRQQGLRKRGSGARREDRPNMYYPVYYSPETGTISLLNFPGAVEIFPKLSDGTDGRWRWGKGTFAQKIEFVEVKLVQGRNEYDVYEKVYLGDGDEERTMKLKSFLQDAKYTSDTATTEYRSIMPGKTFESPKPSSFIALLATIATDKDSVILDFFSGSATTAHAVMKLNAEDGGHRKFIMVQLPEITDEKSEARKAGYETICQIGEERIRRAGKKVKEEAGLNGQDLDTGFRVLKLDSSNMEDVFYTPEDFNENTLFNTVDNVKPDRTPLDLLFQVMPELNIELSAKIEEKDVNGKKVFFVDGSYLIATFDTDVNESTVTEIAKMQPQYFVMRDASAANDNVLDNFEQIFRHYSPDTIRKIL
ncbi:MAG: site-specific DNA-methyltransferase [Muribaculum sp.]|nr:site-specific DNA-methyltransferase [Muribaculum sp.]